MTTRPFYTGGRESDNIYLTPGVTDLCVCVQFAGQWYRVGLAYDSEKFVPFRDKLKASMGLVSVLPDGNVNLTMWDAT